uniref:Uncharacterized protein n=1 Tax=Rhizophora mucronata TaxID=61149 RepID=A0A2P2NPH8_RHIMU
MVMLVQNKRIEEKLSIGMLSGPLMFLVLLTDILMEVDE